MAVHCHIFSCYLCYAVMSVYWSLDVTCLERADPLVLLCVVFSFRVVTFLIGVRVRYGT